MDMDISMDIHEKSVDMDMDMDVIFHIHGNPAHSAPLIGFFFFFVFIFFSSLFYDQHGSLGLVTNIVDSLSTVPLLSDLRRITPRRHRSISVKFFHVDDRH